MKIGHLEITAASWPAALDSGRLIYGALRGMGMSRRYALRYVAGAVLRAEIIPDLEPTPPRVYVREVCDPNEETS